MTFKEKLKMLDPTLIDDDFVGGCCGCPMNFGFEKAAWSGCSNMFPCEECWNREVPEEEPEC